MVNIHLRVGGGRDPRQPHPENNPAAAAAIQHSAGNRQKDRRIGDVSGAAIEHFAELGRPVR